MGFAKMPSSPKTVSTPPPVVAETVESDTQADYEQRASRKKGLLSTILSNQKASGGSLTPQSTANKTLG